MKWKLSIQIFTYIKYVQNICNILLNLYNSGLFVPFFNEGILKIPGIKLIAKGVIKDSKKLDNTSVNRCICVFLYTTQKQDK